MYNPTSGPVPMGASVGREPIWGVLGTGSENMLVRGDSKIFYVDSGHANANDDNEGLDPLYPLATIQGLITRTIAQTPEPYLEDHDIVYVSGTVSEDVTTGDYTEMPSYVQIIGAGNSRYAVQWEGDDAATPSLDLRCVGWRVANFRFYGKTGASCIELRHTDTGANDIAIRTVIENCYFDGLTTGLRGIGSHGCYDVWVVNCTFSLFHNVGGTAHAMEVLTTPLAIPYRNFIVDCMFYDNDNHATWNCNGSIITGCIFQPVGYAYTATVALHTAIAGPSGDDNIVRGCTLPGDYSIAGGLYNPGVADVWLGNYADDTAEAEVGDNGLTILPPA